MVESKCGNLQYFQNARCLKKSDVANFSPKLWLMKTLQIPRNMKYTAVTMNPVDVHGVLNDQGNNIYIFFFTKHFPSPQLEAKLCL